MDAAGLHASAERSITPSRAGSDEPLRRVLNVLVAVIGIVIAAPLMVVIALLVKLDSRGPAIYRQPRVGLDRRRGRGPDSEDKRCHDVGGLIFTIFKFRTMTWCERAPEQKWATKDDQRVTRIGRLLRATRLDEVPQLFNVLKGDMNIVGPRPEQPSIFAVLRDELSNYHERQKVLPGITGWAQVNLGYDANIDDVKRKVELDLEYIGKRSATEDLAIMARTMPIMLLGQVWM